MQHYGWYYLAKYDLGRYGVDLFFVLSGFLITGILINSEEGVGRSLITFYGRRFLRIFPIYYSTILILFVLNDPNVTNSIVSLVTYTFNYSAIKNKLGISDISHMWSLSVEEQFYIVWPFLILPFRKNRLLLLLFVSLIIVTSVVQLVFHPFMNEKFNYIATFPRTYFLAMGGLAAILFKNHKVRGSYVTDVFFILISIALIILDAHWSEIALAVAWVYFIVKSISGNVFVGFLEKILNNRLLQRVGVVSYGIYVFHKPLAQYVFNPLYHIFQETIVRYHIGKPISYINYHPYFLPMIVYPVLAYLFAVLSFRYFEQPLLKLKDKLFGTRKASISKSPNNTPEIVLTD